VVIVAVAVLVVVASEGGRHYTSDEARNHGFYLTARTKERYSLITLLITLE